MKKWSILIFMIYLHQSIFADVTSAMNDFYNNISVVGNDPTIVHTQSANIVSAGGFSTRSKSITLQPFAFTPPSFNASCGNMNFYSGAFSYLSNTDQLMAFLQNTLITAAPLIFINALKAISPSLAGSIQSFFDAAQKILELASNSCKLGTYLGSMAGTYAGKSIANAQGVSQAQGSDASGSLVNGTVPGGSTNLSSQINTWSKAMDDWATNANAVLNPDVTNDPLGLAKMEMANTYGSIVWKGMQQLAIANCTGCNGVSNMTDLANLIISLTGDVVIVAADRTGMGVKAVPYEPLMKVKDFYEGMPNPQAIYNCTSFDVAHPVECNNFNPLPVSNMTGGFKEQVNKMIANVQTSLTNNTLLSQDSLRLISISPIPIFQIAQACADAGLTSQISNLLDKYSNEIAFALTQAMVDEAMKLASVAIATRNIKDVQVKGAVDKLSDSIKVVREQLRADSQKYGQNNMVQILRDMDYLRRLGQNQYSPSLLQKIQFAKSFNNH
ncbi:MAG: conjugal transfer protein TraH [Burkholderiales bacterium]|nr:conjugal transfer protein TraH [Burkholderiales bacterium]